MRFNGFLAVFLGLCFPVSAGAIDLFEAHTVPLTRNYRTPSTAHLEDLTMPDCTASTSLIVTPATISGVDFTDAATPVYCFEPGDYTSFGQIHPDSSEGTASSRRWLMYYDAEDPQTGRQLLDSRRTHPYQRPPDKRAIVFQIRLNGTDAKYTRFWVITGLTLANKGTSNGIDEHNISLEGDDIIVDFVDAYNTWGDEDPGAQVPSLINVGYASRASVDWNTDGVGPSRWTIQRSTLHDAIKLDLGDTAGITVSTSDTAGVNYLDWKIIDNDIWDTGDGIQVVCCSGVGNESIEPGRVPNSLIHGNHIWFTGKWDAPCDYVQGEGMVRFGLSPSNKCSCAENALDMKSGGVFNNPLTLSMNLVSHTSPTTGQDGGDNCGSSGSQGAITTQGNQGAEYQRWVNNVVWSFSKGLTGTSVAHNVEWLYNIFGEIREVATCCNLIIQQVNDRTKVFGNVFSGAGASAPGNLGSISTVDGGEDWADYHCNVFVSDGAFVGSTQVPGPDLFSDYNYMYASNDNRGANGGVLSTERTDDDVNSMFVNDTSGHGMGDLCVMWKRWAFVNGETACISNVITTAASPHVGLCSAATRSSGQRGGGVSEIGHPGDNEITN